MCWKGHLSGFVWDTLFIIVCVYIYIYISSMIVIESDTE